MKVHYSLHSTDLGNQGFYMPMLRGRVHGSRGAQTLRFLVDTGAAFNSIPRAVAEAIGLEPTGMRITVIGAGDVQLEGELCRGRLSLVDDNHEAQFVALDDSVPVLGHVDFLQRRRVLFDSRERYFILERPRH